MRCYLACSLWEGKHNCSHSHFSSLCRWSTVGRRVRGCTGSPIRASAKPLWNKEMLNSTANHNWENSPAMVCLAMLAY